MQPVVYIGVVYLARGYTAECHYTVSQKKQAKLFLL